MDLGEFHTKFVFLKNLLSENTDVIESSYQHAYLHHLYIESFSFLTMRSSNYSLGSGREFADSDIDLTL